MSKTLHSAVWELETDGGTKWGGADWSLEYDGDIMRLSRDGRVVLTADFRDGDGCESATLIEAFMWMHAPIGHTLVLIHEETKI